MNHDLTSPAGAGHEVIDAHLHLWQLDSGDYTWLSDDLEPINRDIEFAEIEPQLNRAGVDRVVLVQAANTITDTEAMLAVSPDRVAGVVGWVDLLDPEAVTGQLEQWADQPRLVGIRHLIHDEPDPDWLAQPQVGASLRQLAAAGLSYDVVGVLPRHLQLAIALADALPELRLVIDHLGTPPVAVEGDNPWTQLIEQLAQRPNVWIKLSGLTTLAPSGHNGAAQLAPFVDHALDRFGPSRMLYGGDWPVSTLASSYAQTWLTTQELIHRLSGAEQDAILGGTAREVYRLD